MTNNQLEDKLNFTNTNYSDERNRFLRNAGLMVAAGVPVIAGCTAAQKKEKNTFNSPRLGSVKEKASDSQVVYNLENGGRLIIQGNYTSLAKKVVTGTGGTDKGLEGLYPADNYTDISKSVTIINTKRTENGELTAKITYNEGNVTKTSSVNITKGVKTINGYLTQNKKEIAYENTIRQTKDGYMHTIKIGTDYLKLDSKILGIEKTDSFREASIKAQNFVEQNGLEYLAKQKETETKKAKNVQVKKDKIEELETTIANLQTKNTELSTQIGTLKAEIEKYKTTTVKKSDHEELKNNSVNKTKYNQLENELKDLQTKYNTNKKTLESKLEELKTLNKKNTNLNNDLNLYKNKKYNELIFKKEGYNLMVTINSNLNDLKKYDEIVKGKKASYDIKELFEIAKDLNASDMNINKDKIVFKNAGTTLLNIEKENNDYKVTVYLKNKKVTGTFNHKEGEKEEMIKSDFYKSIKGKEVQGRSTEVNTKGDLSDLMKDYIGKVKNIELKNLEEKTTKIEVQGINYLIYVGIKGKDFLIKRRKDGPHDFYDVKGDELKELTSILKLDAYKPFAENNKKVVEHFKTALIDKYKQDKEESSTIHNIDKGNSPMITYGIPAIGIGVVAATILSGLALYYSKKNSSNRNRTDPNQ